MTTAKRDRTATPVQGDTPQLLTVHQVAERLNVSESYVRRRLVFERRIPYIKFGRKLRIDLADLEAFIDNGRVAPERYGQSEIKFVTRVGRTRRG
jgi:excisionase family DNA binding protein